MVCAIHRLVPVVTRSAWWPWIRTDDRRRTNRQLPNIPLRRRSAAADPLPTDDCQLTTLYLISSIILLERRRWSMMSDQRR